MPGFIQPRFFCSFFSLTATCFSFLLLMMCFGSWQAVAAPGQGPQLSTANPLTTLEGRNQLIGFLGQSVVTETTMRVVGTQFGSQNTVAMRLKINPNVVALGNAGEIPDYLFIVLTETYLSQQQAQMIFNAAGSTDEIVMPAFADIYMEAAPQFESSLVSHGEVVANAVNSFSGDAQAVWTDAFDYVGAYYIAEAKLLPIEGAIEKVLAFLDPFSIAFADLDGSFDFSQIVVTTGAYGAGGAVAGSVVPGIGTGAGAAAGAISGAVGQTILEIWDVIGDAVLDYINEPVTKKPFDPSKPILIGHHLM